MLAGARVFALPCVVERDGGMDVLPTVLMEAMASRVPVVVSQVAGIPELVEDGISGRLVPPGNAAALAEAIVAILASDDRRMMGEAGRAKVVAAFNSESEAAWLGQLFLSYNSGGPRLPKRPEGPA
jgi:glycosyltransferase involved in cell wall biosynthesis